MVIAGAKHGDGVHNATNAWTATVVQDGAKLKVDVRHDRLDVDQEHGAVDVRIECLGVKRNMTCFAVALFAGVAAKVPPVTPVMDEATLAVSDEILRT